MALDRLLQSVPLGNNNLTYSTPDAEKQRLINRCDHEILEVHSAMTGGDYIIKCQRCPKTWKDFAVLAGSRSR